MQINSLYINDYKPLKNFTVNFNKEISILIGINGSGKSSILECVAQIFSDAYLQEKSKFGFKLEYELCLEEIIKETAMSLGFKTDYIRVEIYAEKKGEKLLYRVHTGGNILEKETDIEKKFGSLEKLLPDNIVIYYSGLADGMKKICLPHDKKLSANFRKGNTNAHRPFLFFEPPLFSLILTTLLSYEYGKIPKFLFDKAKIKGVQSIQIKIKKPVWGKGKVNEWWGAKGEVKTFLDYLAGIASPLTTEERKAGKLNGSVTIETWENEAVIAIAGQEKLFEIKAHFVEERTLFKILNTLLIDGFQPEAEFSFIQDGASGQRLFNVLSEGEQQAIIIRGLTELANNENTLFLFDEPDTYLHPSWQRGFIESINEFAKYHNNSQFLIATHSPQLLSNAHIKNCDVRIMEDGKIVKVIPKYYGRDISVILYEMMGVERRNEEVTKSLSVLFNAIEDEDLENSKNEYKKLAELLGEDDPEMVRAKVQLDYLQEEKNEANS